MQFTKKLRSEEENGIVVPWKGVAVFLSTILTVVVTSWCGYVTVASMENSKELIELRKDKEEFKRVIVGLQNAVEGLQTTVRNLGTRTNYLDLVTGAGKSPESMGIVPYPPGILEQLPELTRVDAPKAKK